MLVYIITDETYFLDTISLNCHLNNGNRLVRSNKVLYNAKRKIAPFRL